MMVSMLRTSLRALLVGVLSLGSASCARTPATEKESAPAPPRVVERERAAEEPSPPPSGEPGSPPAAAAPVEAEQAPEGAVSGESKAAERSAAGSGASPRMEAPKQRSAPRAGRPGSVDSLQDPDALSFEGAERELHAAFGKLGGELRLASPDCPTARQLAGRVCELAEHICRIAERGEDPVRLATCVDGRNRCSEARRRIEDKCSD